MKKFLYIVAFILFGLISATIVHAILELIALEVIFGNPAKFADTFWWQKWYIIHLVVANTLWLLGFVYGVKYGFKYWVPYGSKPGFYHWHKKEEN